jgi:hypothetical protein
MYVSACIAYKSMQVCKSGYSGESGKKSRAGEKKAGPVKK